MFVAVLLPQIRAEEVILLEAYFIGETQSDVDDRRVRVLQAVQRIIGENRIGAQGRTEVIDHLCEEVLDAAFDGGTADQTDAGQIVSFGRVFHHPHDVDVFQL